MTRVTTGHGHAIQFHDQAKQLMSQQLRKTQMCKHHMRAVCKLGDACNYAHALSELRVPPDLSKTRMCDKPDCTDPTCKYAHIHDELHATTSHFRTTLCAWYAKGKCKYGASCRFAHGKDKLRTATDVSDTAEGASSARTSPQLGPQNPPEAPVVRQSPSLTPQLTPPTGPSGAPAGAPSPIVLEAAAAPAVVPKVRQMPVWQLDIGAPPGLSLGDAMEASTPPSCQATRPARQPPSPTSPATGPSPAMSRAVPISFSAPTPKMVAEAHIYAAAEALAAAQIAREGSLQKHVVDGSAGVFDVHEALAAENVPTPILRALSGLQGLKPPAGLDELPQLPAGAPKAGWYAGGSESSSDTPVLRNGQLPGGSKAWSGSSDTSSDTSVLRAGTTPSFLGPYDPSPETFKPELLHNILAELTARNELGSSTGQAVRLEDIQAELSHGLLRQSNGSPQEQKAEMHYMHLKERLEDLKVQMLGLSEMIRHCAPPGAVID